MHRMLTRNQITITEWWAFLPEAKATEKAFLEQTIKQSIDAQRRLQDYKNSPRFVNKVRKYAARCGYTDKTPYEVIWQISPTRVIVRQMKATLVQAPIMHPGGFSAYTENYTQKWECTPDPEAAEVTIRISKKGWAQGTFRMGDEPVKFYDYNF